MEASTAKGGARGHCGPPPLCLASVTPEWPALAATTLDLQLLAQGLTPSASHVPPALSCGFSLKPHSVHPSRPHAQPRTQWRPTYTPAVNSGQRDMGGRGQFPFLTPDGWFEIEKFYRASPKTSSEMDSFQKASRVSICSPLPSLLLPWDHTPQYRLANKRWLRLQSLGKPGSEKSIHLSCFCPPCQAYNR